MHHFTKRINLKSFLVSALLFAVSGSLAQGQYQGRYIQQPRTQNCPFRNGWYACTPASPMLDGLGQPISPSVESVARQRAEMQSRQDDEPLLHTALQRDEPRPNANPDAPDQSEALKNAKDHDFILRNFKTMYIETRGIGLFGPSQIKAELEKNGDFQKLNIHIVDDRKVADTVLVVTYTFAWDYPFELRHQNTTMVLLGGKGEGPFSGPLGAWDVARQFVKAAKKWRPEPEQKASAEPKAPPTEKK